MSLFSSDLLDIWTTVVGIVEEIFGLILLSIAKWQSLFDFCYRVFHVAGILFSLTVPRWRCELHTVYMHHMRCAGTTPQMSMKINDSKFLLMFELAEVCTEVSPSVWTGNMLPALLHLVDNQTYFKHLLKAQLCDWSCNA